MKKCFLMMILPLVALVSMVSCKGEDLESRTNGYEYVDLGLPSGLLWATMNVGAREVEESGALVAWGESKPKSIYSASTYSYFSSGKYTKYVDDSDYGVVDNKSELDLSDDVARKAMGGSWRIPTQSDFNELLNYCTYEKCEYNGVYGMKFIGKEGKFIFLPAAGYGGEDVNSSFGKEGNYWSRTANGSMGAFSFLFGKEVSPQMKHYYRYYGFSVRGVCER